MSTKRSGRSAVTVAALAGFLAGAVAMAVVLLGFSNLLRSPMLSGRPTVEPRAAERTESPAANDAAGRVVQPAPSATRTTPPGITATPATPTPSPTVLSPTPTEATPPTTIAADPAAELRNRKLDVPVRGVPRSALRESFTEARRTNEDHEAIDILAPRNTPVVAVEDGTIAKLFDSKKGGTTVYQFDPASRYAYYYAHLERYADGVKEGNRVQRGQLLGYVGTSGNAPKDTPHLHFAIFRLTDKKQWWQGQPIDPYEVLK